MNHVPGHEFSRRDMLRGLVMTPALTGFAGSVSRKGFLYAGSANLIHVMRVVGETFEHRQSIESKRPAALAAHPSVAEAAVVSAPDPLWGEIPVAFVVTKPNLHCTEDELHDFAALRLAKFKLPKKYVFPTEPLPKSGTGKILKRELREQFWQGKDRRVQG